jgi:hypothetical protein
VIRILVGLSEILDFLGFSLPINCIGNKEHHQESFLSNTQHRQQVCGSQFVD